MTHLKRDLMHAVWEILLDNEFMHAYKHGIVLRCADGVIWQIYPRIFTYSADYLEKYMICHYHNELLMISTRVVLVTICYLANSPCPRCLRSEEHTSELQSRP